LHVRVAAAGLAGNAVITTGRQAFTGIRADFAFSAQGEFPVSRSTGAVGIIAGNAFTPAIVFLTSSGVLANPEAVRFGNALALFARDGRIQATELVAEPN
jgi:hypothetical protein